MAYVNVGFMKLILAFLILVHLEGALAFRDPIRDEGLVIDEERLPPPPPVYPWAGVDTDTYVPMDMNVTRIDAIEDDEDMPPGLRHAAVSMMRFFHDAGIVRLSGRELRIEAGLAADDDGEEQGSGGGGEEEAENGQGEREVVHQVVAESDGPLVSVHVVEVDSESEADLEESGGKLVEKDDTEEKVDSKTDEEYKRKAEKENKNGDDEKVEEKEEDKGEKDKKEEENNDSEELADTGLEDAMRKLGVNDEEEDVSSAANTGTETEKSEEKQQGERKGTQSTGEADDSEASVSDGAVTDTVLQDGVSDQRDNAEQSSGEEGSESDESHTSEMETKKGTEKPATDEIESASSADGNSQGLGDVPVIHRPVPRRIQDIPSIRVQAAEPTIAMQNVPQRTMVGSWFITGGSGIV